MIVIFLTFQNKFLERILRNKSLNIIFENLKIHKFLKKQLIITKDGSHSLFVPGLNETYHSKYGAITEAMHVFIRNGLHFNPKQNLNILEIGFGTGLNTLLTLENLQNKKVHYTTLEPFPIAEEIYNKLNFHTFTKSDEEIFLNLHNCEWEKEIKLSTNFSFLKTNNKLLSEEDILLEIISVIRKYISFIVFGFNIVEHDKISASPTKYLHMYNVYLFLNSIY